jgi:hypothetical protein
MTKANSIQNLLSGKLCAGINFFFSLANCQADALNEFILQQANAIRISHSQSLPAGFTYTRRLYKSLRVDPTKHRPSSEALWRRLRDKNDFPAVNPIVDLTNLLSLKFQICYGLYDLDRIQGPVEITLGDENDRYQGIRKEPLNLQGRIVLKDTLGAFGNPSADSLRTSANEGCLNIMQVLFFHPDDHEKVKIAAETLALFRRFFTINDMRSFFLETNEKKGIFPEGEPCKTSESRTHSLNPG